MAHVRAGENMQAWGGRLGRITMAAVALIAGLGTGAYAAPAAARTAVSTARSACSLLTHAQVAAIIDASRFNETISTPDHCSWDTPGPEITSNGVQLETQKVTPTNTLADGPDSGVRSGCGSNRIKHFEEQGVIGYYCVYALAISGAQMFAQEGQVQIWIPVNYGLPADTVKAPALVADAVQAVKELNA